MHKFNCSLCLCGRECVCACAEAGCLSCKVPLCASVDLLTNLQKLIFAKRTPENKLLLFSTPLRGSLCLLFSFLIIRKDKKRFISLIKQKHPSQLNFITPKPAVIWIGRRRRRAEVTGCAAAWLADWHLFPPLLCYRCRWGRVTMETEPCMLVCASVRKWNFLVSLSAECVEECVRKICSKRENSEIQHILNANFCT